MQLLSSNGNDIANAEFATLSLLGHQHQGPLSCCIVVVSPLITTPSSLSQHAVTELHQHLELLDSHSDSEERKDAPSLSVTKEQLLDTPQAQKNEQNDGKESQLEKDLISQLFQQQYSQIVKNSSHVQSYRPSCAGGRITLFYKILSNTSSFTINALFGTDLSSENHHINSKPLLCVGVIGDCSLLYPQLKDNMLQFTKWLESYNDDDNSNQANNNVSGDLATLLTTALTSLLLDEESIQVTGQLNSNINNDSSSSDNAGGMMMMSMNSGASSIERKFQKSKSYYSKTASNNVARVLFMKKRKAKSNLKNNDWNHERTSSTTSLKSGLTASSSSSLPSSDIARIIADQLQVLSLAENDMVHLRGYTTNNNNTNNKNYTNYRKKGMSSIKSPNRGSLKNINHTNQQSQQQPQFQNFGQNQQQSQRSSGEGSDLSGFDYHPPHYYHQQSNIHDALHNGIGSVTMVDDLYSRRGSNTTASISSISSSDNLSLSSDSLTAFSVRSFTSGRSTNSSFSSSTNTNSSNFNSSSIAIPTLVGPTRDSDVSKKDYRKNRILAASQKKLNQHSIAMTQYNRNQPKHQYLQINNSIDISYDNKKPNHQNNKNIDNTNNSMMSKLVVSSSPNRDSRLYEMTEYNNKPSTVSQSFWPSQDQGSKTSMPSSKITSDSPTSKLEGNQNGAIFDPFSFEDKNGTANSITSPSLLDNNRQSKNAVFKQYNRILSSYSGDEIKNGTHQPYLLTSGYDDGNDNLIDDKKEQKLQNMTNEKDSMNSLNQNSWSSPKRLPKIRGLLENDQPELKLNVALNEDLTCSYRNSKLSTCSIEGIVQIQIKSGTNHQIPFALSIYDNSKHIKTIQENKRFVEDITADTKLYDNGNKDFIHRNPLTEVTYKYVVTVPKADQYFPILRYKCGSELRPVPIRVQTRVRVHDRFCRVALQISSNPANEDDLTDLTIMMAVPPLMKGESLTTSPAGGVWNEVKRSVIWSVAELGIGQKFQLQAQFEMNKKLNSKSDDKEIPTFPVLVRCQCMFTQLSNIGIEVSGIPEIYPSRVIMQMAKRARISHKER